MIKNERQYRITNAQAEQFERALAAEPDRDLHPLLVKAQEDALRSQLADLRVELEEYEALRAGRRAVPELTSYLDLPRLLIQRRIALGLSQKDLADRLGLKEQQVQRYEATDYTAASFARLREVIEALELSVPKSLGGTNGEMTLSTLLKRLEGLGLDRTFVMRRLVPRQVLAGLESEEAERRPEAKGLVLQAAEAAARSLGLPADALFTPRPPRLEPVAVRLKVAERVDAGQRSAYTVYAHYLALLLLEATRDLPPKPVCTDPREVRRALLDAYGSVEFGAVLRYCWDAGVPVLPLRDPGAFHGACWRVGGRNVIALKQRTSSAARWAFDGLHEFRHAGEAPEQDTFSVLEADEQDQEHWRKPEEWAASQYAGNVLLDGRAEDLAHRCAAMAGGSIPRLKSVVPQVASQANVPVGALANYVAWRLALEGQNWWGAATALQAGGTDPWVVARDLLLQRTDMDRLNEVDRGLLMQALAGDEE